MTLFNAAGIPIPDPIGPVLPDAAITMMPFSTARSIIACIGSFNPSYITVDKLNDIISTFSSIAFSIPSIIQELSPVPFSFNTFIECIIEFGAIPSESVS